MDHQRDYGHKAPRFVPVRWGDAWKITQHAMQQVLKTQYLSGPTAHQLCDMLNTAHALLGKAAADALVERIVVTYSETAPEIPHG